MSRGALWWVGALVLGGACTPERDAPTVDDERHATLPSPESVAAPPPAGNDGRAAGTSPSTALGHNPPSPHPTPHERLGRVRDAAEREDGDALDVLIAGLRDEDFRIRRDAATGIAARGAAAARSVPALRERLGDEFAIVRQRALEALVAIATDEARDAVAEAALEPDAIDVELRLDACATLRDPRCLDATATRLHSDDPYSVQSAASLLARHGAPARPVLMDALSTRLEGESACRAARALAWIGPDDADSGAMERSAIAAARARGAVSLWTICLDGTLATLGDTDAAARLRAELGASDRARIDAVAEALGRWPSPEAVTLLVMLAAGEAGRWIDGPVVEHLVRRAEESLGSVRDAFTEAQNERKYGLAAVLLRSGSADDARQVTSWLAGRPEDEAHAELTRQLEAGRSPPQR